MLNVIRSFKEDFQDLVNKKLDNPALIDGKGEKQTIISYSELSNLIDKCLTLLQDKGLKAGDTILSLMPNNIETIIIFFAAIKGGYNFAPLACTVSQRELEKWISLTNPNICFTTDLINDPDKQALLSEKITTIITQTDCLFTWLPKSVNFTQVNNKNAQIYLSTSGTTGEPKAIVIDADKLWSSGYAFAKHHNMLNQNLRFWNFLPMSYLGGLFNLVMIPICTGGSVVIDEPFSGKTFLQFFPFIDRFEINTLWLVPTIMRGIITLATRAKRDSLQIYKEKIKYCLLGTAPIDLRTKQQFEELFGITPLENFALSETTFITSETLQNIDLRVEGSVGEILPYINIKFKSITNDDDIASSPTSEIYIKSPFLFTGYLQTDGSIVNPCDADGFLPTGDLGYMNEHNTLFINGRLRDIIKKGGYFVPLREIEILAQQYKSINEAVAVKTKHDFYGESYVLFIKSNNQKEENIKDEFSSWLHKNLVQYKWPEKVIFVDDFPRTSSGKIRKHMLI